MARRKTRFKMTLKELSFEYEGDEETAQTMHNSMTRALSAIANTQAPLLGDEPIDVAAAPLLEAPAAPRSGRGSRKPGNGEDSSRPRRPRQAGATAQLVSLHQANYFSELRSVNDVKQELSRYGHNFSSNTLSTALVRAVQKKLLVREQDAEGEWNYQSTGDNGQQGS